MKRLTPANDADICYTCQATRWEHSVDQWIYCHMPIIVSSRELDDYGILKQEFVGET